MTSSGDEPSTARSTGGGVPRHEAANLANQISKAQQYLGAGRQRALERTEKTRTLGRQYIPLTANQERLLILDRVSPNLPLYVVNVRYSVRGLLDVEALQSALNALVQRHHILRTSYHQLDDYSYQRVHAAGSVELALRRGSIGTEAEGWNWLDLEGRRPFALSSPPVIRSAVLGRAPDDWTVQLSVHHIACDGTSMSLIETDLWSMYEDFAAGLVPDINPHRLQYGDVALLARSYRAGSRAYEADKNYWLSNLRGAPYLELLPDYARGDDVGGEGAELSCTLPTELTSSLEELARTERCSLFVVLQAALSILLSKYTGTVDVVTGTASGGRERSDFDSIVGFFVNLLVLRTRIEGQSSLREIVHLVRGTVLDTLDHAEFPFEDLVQELRPTRSPGRNPLFQVDFELHYRSAKPVDLAGLTIQAAAGPAVRDSWFDLVLLGIRNETTLSLSLTYLTRLFSEKRMQILLDDYVLILRKMVGSPDSRVDALQLVSLEKAEELYGLPITDSAAPDVVDRIGRNAAAMPNGSAVRADDLSLTYEQLWAAAVTVATDLKDMGVRPGDAVGLHLGRSGTYVVCALAVMMCEAHFVPLSLEQPEMRRAAVASATDLSVVVTIESPIALAVRQLQVSPAKWRESVPGDRSLPFWHQEVAYWSDSSPNAAAYVLFTSGSTGSPKGVIITRRSLAAFVDDIANLFDMRTGTRVAQFASTIFDVSIFDIFATLATGGTVCVPADSVRVDPHALSAYLRAEQVEVADLPPAIMKLMDVEEYPHLRVVSVGGEPFGAELVNRWNRYRTQFWNTYGPTETTVISLYHLCEKRPYDSSPPIGTPMPRERAILIDPNGHPCQVGVPGELFIGGAGLAHGYLSDPALTASRFVASWIGGRPGERFYRTGDLCVLGIDGRITYLARTDKVTKIRGHRVSLTEIEEMLSALPGIDRAAVEVFRRSTEDEAELYAFVEGAREFLDPVGVRRALGAVAPSYMVPSHIVPIRRLPVTVSGKVDRARLMAGLQGLETALVEKQAEKSSSWGSGDRIHQSLVGIFSKILRVDSFDPAVSFFDLGGNSLQLTSLCAAINDSLGVRIEPNELFAAQSVEQIATLVGDKIDGRSAIADESTGNRAASTAQVKLPVTSELGPQIRQMRKRTAQPPLVLIHDGSGSLYPYRRLTQRMGGGTEVLGVDPAPPGSSSEHTVESLASAYLGALQGNWPDSQFMVAGWSFGGLVAYEMLRQSQSTHQMCLGAVMLDAQHPSTYSDREESVEVMFLQHLQADGFLPADVTHPLFAVTTRAEVPDKILERLSAMGAELSTDEARSVVERFSFFREYVRAARTYVPTEVDAPVLLVSAERRSSNVAAWRRAIGDALITVDVPGDHYSMLRDRSGDMVGDRIRAFISSVTEK